MVGGDFAEGGEGGVGGEVGRFDAFAGAEFGDGGEEGFGVGMLWVADDLLGGADFDGVAFPHDHDAVADVFDDGEVVRDEKHGDAALALDVLEEVDDLGADGNVEGADGFVANEEARFDSEGAGDADALALAAAEFVGVTVDVFGKEADGFEEVADAGFAVVAIGGEAMDVEGFADDFADGHARIE